MSARQAREIGFSHQAQKYHVDHGNWLRVERGIFRLRDWPSTIEDSYALWTLWSGGRGVVSHDTATVVHDLGVLNPAKVHLTVPHGFRARHPVVLTTVAHLCADDVEDRGAYRVTTPLRTLVDVAVSWDVTQEEVDDAVGEALDHAVVTSDALQRSAEERGDRAALRIGRALAAVAG